MDKHTVAILVLVTLTNVALAVLNWSFMVRAKDRMRDIEWWFMKHPNCSNLDEEDRD